MDWLNSKSGSPTFLHLVQENLIYALFVLFGHALREQLLRVAGVLQALVVIVDEQDALVFEIHDPFLRHDFSHDFSLAKQFFRHPFLEKIELLGDAPYEFDKDLAFKLVLDDFCLLVDEPEDVWGQLRDQVLPLADQLLIVGVVVVGFVILLHSLQVVAHSLLVLLQEIRHQELHTRFQMQQVGGVKAGSAEHGLVVVDPAEEQQQMAICLLLRDLLEVWHDVSLDVFLVFDLEHLHDFEAPGEAGHHVVPDFN